MSNLSTYHVIVYRTALCVLSKDILHNMSQNLFLLFLLKVSSMASGLKFRSMVQFELIFIYGLRFIFRMNLVHLLNRQSIPHWITLVSLPKINCYGLFLDSPFCTLGLIIDLCNCLLNQLRGKGARNKKYIYTLFYIYLWS